MPSISDSTLERHPTTTNGRDVDLNVHMIQTLEHPHSSLQDLTTSFLPGDFLDSTVLLSAEEYPIQEEVTQELAFGNVNPDSQLQLSLPAIPPNDVFFDDAALPTPQEMGELSMTNSPHRPQKHLVHPCKEELLAEIDLFITNGYECYPILYMDSVIERVRHGEQNSNPEFKTLALSIVMMNEALKFYRSPRQSPARVDALMETIENIRFNAHDYHFADMPSLDTVTVSWCLFMACIFRGKYYKGFAYLTEAIGLLDLVVHPSEPLEIARLYRLEYMLFITESGAISLFGPPDRRRLAKWPQPFQNVGALLFPYHQSRHGRTLGQQTMAALDRRAVELLLLMGQLHAALGPDEVASVMVEDRFMAAMSAAVVGDVTRGGSVSIQTADVAITRQWKLASHWQALLRGSEHTAQHRTALNCMLQTLGMTALQWVNTQTVEQLRLINHGKLVALTEAIIYIASAIGEQMSCANTIADLISTVAQVDYEQAFATKLSTFGLSNMKIPSLISWKDQEQVESTQAEAHHDMTISTNSLTTRHDSIQLTALPY